MTCTVSSFKIMLALFCGAFISAIVTAGEPRLESHYGRGGFQGQRGTVIGSCAMVPLGAKDGKVRYATCKHCVRSPRGARADRYFGIGIGQRPVPLQVESEDPVADLAVVAGDAASCAVAQRKLPTTPIAAYPKPGMNVHLVDNNPRGTFRRTVRVVGRTVDGSLIFSGGVISGASGSGVYLSEGGPLIGIVWGSTGRHTYASPASRIGRKR